MMEKIVEFRSGGCLVEPDNSPLMFTGVGINHQAKLGKAPQLVDVAADLVKVQCGITDREIVSTDMTPANIRSERIWAIIKRRELKAAEREVQGPEDMTSFAPGEPSARKDDQ